MRSAPEESVARLDAALCRRTPELARHTGQWMSSLAGGQPAHYFTHPDAFPMLQLPRWVEESITSQVGAQPDAELQVEIGYATVCGYYFVRLVDDLMDGDNPPPAPVIPAMIVLHTEFLAAYQHLFAADHPFWADLVRYSDSAAETASADAAFETVNREQFERVSARKTVGAKISIAAVCHRYGRADLLPGWSDFVDLLGRWHQMRNDVHGWLRDGERRAATYFRSEAARRSPDGRLAIQSLAGAGLDWAGDELSAWMDEMLMLAVKLGSAGLIEYLVERRAVTSAEWQQAEEDLTTLAMVAASLGDGHNDVEADDGT